MSIAMIAITTRLLDAVGPCRLLLPGELMLLLGVTDVALLRSSTEILCCPPVELLLLGVVVAALLKGLSESGEFAKGDQLTESGEFAKGVNETTGLMGAGAAVGPCAVMVTAAGWAKLPTGLMAERAVAALRSSRTSNCRATRHERRLHGGRCGADPEGEERRLIEAGQREANMGILHHGMPGALPAVGPSAFV
jgi:hypothetical protein